MGVNLDKPHLWKADIAQSVDLYNDWFLRFAPGAFRTTRLQTTRDVEATLQATANLTDIRPAVLRRHPQALPTLRMATCPPLAADRLVGLAGVPKSLVGRMEKEGKLPIYMSAAQLDAELAKIGQIITRMADPDIFVWLGREAPPAEAEVHRAATIVADRLCGAVANPIIRNAQEQRQLAALAAWLDARGYARVPTGAGMTFSALPPGRYGFHMNVPVTLEGGVQSVNIPVDVVVQPHSAGPGALPLFLEAKSAGDFANVNKRRKEEAVKMAQLRASYGAGVRFVLFLCGYFDGGYLGYEAAEGIDWIWEHRMDDLAQLGL